MKKGFKRWRGGGGKLYRKIIADLNKKLKERKKTVKLSFQLTCKERKLPRVCVICVTLPVVFSTQPAEYSRLKMSWEIPRKDVRLLEQIGRGSFVEVWKGRMRRTPGTNDIVRIIVKKLDSKCLGAFVCCVCVCVHTRIVCLCIVCVMCVCAHIVCM